MSCDNRFGDYLVIIMIIAKSHSCTSEQNAHNFSLESFYWHHFHIGYIPIMKEILRDSK